MAMYKLYAGLNGGFGGATYHTTKEFDTFAEAEQEAYRLAVEEYESYEGMHGILSRADVEEDYCDDLDLSIDKLKAAHMQDIDELYQEEIESWITYYVKEISQDAEEEEE